MNKCHFGWACFTCVCIQSVEELASPLLVHLKKLFTSFYCLFVHLYNENDFLHFILACGWRHLPLFSGQKFYRAGQFTASFIGPFVFTFDFLICTNGPPTAGSRRFCYFASPQCDRYQCPSLQTTDLATATDKKGTILCVQWEHHCSIVPVIWNASSSAEVPVNIVPPCMWLTSFWQIVNAVCFMQGQAGSIAL